MATPGGPDATFTVAPEYDQAAANQTEAKIEAGFKQVSEKITSQFTAEFAKLGQQLGKSIDATSPKIKKLAKDVVDMGTSGEEALKGVDAQVAKLLRVLDRVGRSIQENVGVLSTVREANRRNSVEITRAAEDTARAQVENVRAASRAHSVETQRITTAERSAALERIQISKNEGRQAAIAAQRAAKIRVLATQAALQTIGRLEKGLGVTLAGAARAASTAFSKIFDNIATRRGGGIAGAVARQNTELSGELRRTNSIVETNTRQINNSFTEGTNTSLNKRERLIRDSFRQQETIIRQSAVRQAAVFEGLRKQTQTGVVGAANRGLNIGAFLGGAAIFTAARSTFTVGSEFVRGLAVLQAQLNLTGDEMKTVRQLSIDLGNDITLPGVSALDAAQGIQLLSKQFASLGDGAIVAAEQAAKGTLQLSRAANVGAEEAAQVVGSAVNVFGISADKATDVADQVTAALKNAAGVGFGDFADAFKQAGAVFAQFQVPAVGATEALLEFDTALAVIARAGVVGSDAGTSLKQFFLQATRQAPAAQKALGELTARAGETGSAFFDATGKARPFEKTLDILRKGLEGFNDQQRTTALSTIFGSDAIRVANALLSTSTEEYHKVTQALREQGLAAKIAAAQNAGFKGALDALKSTIETAQILLFEKLDPILKTVTLGFAVLFSNILQGKGVWEIVRRGLLGIAAGLGAVLALKSAIELFQLLGTTLGFLLTPMGAFLAAAAAIGAAISILADQSPEFREALGDIRDVLVDLGKKGVELAGKGLKNLGDIITRDVLPFLEAVGRVIGTKVVAAFRFLSEFVTDTVIPALRTMAEFVQRNASKGWDILVRFFQEKVIPTFRRIVDFVEKAILPKLKQLASFVAGELVDAFKILVDFVTGSVYPAIFGIGLAFGPTGVIIAAAASAIIFFWDSVRPVLQPAIDGFRVLGEALSTAFTLGDLSGVGAGLSAAGSGIAKVASTIGGLIVDVLAAAGQAIVSTLKRVFALPNLIAAGKGFLDFVEFVGNTLGKIVTSPKFVTAVAAIGVALAAAAGLIAIRFLEGFGKAFLDNLPGLAKLIGIALLAALVGPIVLAFKNPKIAAIVIAGFIAIFEARKLIQGISAVFTKAGNQAGVGFTRGLFRTVRQGLSKGIGGTAGLTAGLAGQQAPVIGPAQQSAGFFKQQIDKMVGIQRQLRALGSPTIVSLNPTSLKAANTELAKLKANTSEARLKGLLLRDSFSQIGQGLGTALKGVGKVVGQNISGVLRGIATGVDAANTTSGSGDTAAKGFIRGFRNSIGTDGKAQIKAGFRQAMDGLRDTAVTSGTTTGKLVGKTIARAALGAIIAVGAFQTGKAEGGAGGSGLLSALLGGITAGAVVGGPLGVAMGAVTAASGLLGAAFGRAEAKAKAFQEAVNNLAKSFTDDLVEAINTGQIAVNNFSDTKIDPGAVFSVGDNKKDLAKALADGLPDDVLEKINAQLGRGGVNKIAQFFEDAGGEADKFKVLFSNAMLESGKTARQLLSIAGGDQGVASSLRQLLADIAAPGGPATILDVFNDPKFTSFLSKFGPEVKKVVLANRDLLQSDLNVLTDINSKADIAFEAAKKASNAAFAIADIPAATNQAFEHGGTAGLVSTTKSIRLFEAQIINTAVRTSDSVEGIQDAFDKLGLPPIDQAIIDTYEKQLGQVAAAAEKAQKKVDAIPDRIAAIASLAVADPAQLIQDSAVVQVKADTAGFTDAVANSINHDFDSPEVRLALAQLGSDVSAAISVGITSGQITDKASLEKFLQPIIDAAVANAPTDEQKAKIGEFFTALFEGVSIDLPTEVANLAAAKFQADMAQYMKDHPFTTNIQAQFIIASRTPLTGEAGTALGTRRAGFVAPTQKTLIDDLLPKAEEVRSKAEVVGKAVPVGLTNGMKNPEAITQMLKQVRTLAARSLAQFKQTLGIKSPSKLTAEMGVQLTQGLAIGIESGADAAAKAAAAAAQAAVDAANDVVNKNPVGTPRSGFAPDTEPIHERGRRDARNVGEIVAEGLQWNPDATADQMVEITNRWLNNVLAPDLNAILTQGINDGSVRNQSDADAAVQLELDTFFQRFGNDAKSLPLWGTIESTVVDSFAAVTASAQAAIEAHNEQVLANTERILGHGLPAPTPPPSQTEIAEAQRLFRDNERLQGHGLPVDSANQALQADLTTLIAVAKSLQETAAQMNQRGPDVTNVAITETKDPRATARATITELRAERLLQHGIR